MGITGGGLDVMRSTRTGGSILRTFLCVQLYQELQCICLLETLPLLLAMIYERTCVEGAKMAHWGMGDCIGRFWQG